MFQTLQREYICICYKLFFIFSALRYAQLRHHTTDMKVEFQTSWKQIKHRSKKYGTEGTYEM